MQEEEHYHKQLRLRLQTLLGRKISKNADLLGLEIIINNRINKRHKVSYSTLRRFFGFIPSTAPRPKTLNNLSRSLGYKDFNDFCTKHQVQQVWNLLELFEQVDESNDLSPMLLKQWEQHIEQSYYLSHFSYFLQQQLKASNFELLQQVFKENALFSDNYFDRLRIADVLGIYTRKLTQKEDLDQLIELIYSSDIAEEMFLYLFVDYSSFNGYYGRLIANIDLGRIDKQDDQLFILLLRNTIALFQNRSITPIPLVNSQGMHPVLKGRYHAQQMLVAENRQEYIDTIFNEARISDAKQGYFFEILSAFILTKDLESISKVEKKYYEAILTPQNWVFESKKAFSFIAFALLSIKRKELEPAKITLALIDFSKIENSYRAYIRLLYCIPQYHLLLRLGDDDAALTIKLSYLSIAAELDFSFFSEAFLDKYYLE